MSKVLVVGDTHFPFHSRKAYRKLLKLIEKEKPTHVVQIGDILDQYVFSKYSRSLKVTPHKEIRKGLRLAKRFWSDVKAIVPRAKCYQILGNHDMRLAKRISERLPELEDLVKVQDLYDFEGVRVAKGDRDYFKIDGVIYCHGWLSKSEDHCKYFNKPTVHGHRHRPAIIFENKNLWSMDVGHMADVKSLPLSYTPSKHSRWTMSCGIVEDGKPRLLILET